MKTRYRRAIVALLAVPALTVVACSSGSGSGEGLRPAGSAGQGGATTCDVPAGLNGKFVFGAVLPLSGPSASVGQGALTGLQAQACLINKDGGILGREVVIESRDDAGDGQQAVAAMRDLLATGEVNAVLSGALGPISAAVLPQVTEKGLIAGTPAGSNDVGNKDKYPTNFQFTLTPAQQTDMMLQAAAGLGVNKVGIVGFDDDTGRGYVNGIVTRAGQLGLQIVGQPQFLDAKATDYTAQLQVLRDAGAQVIVGNLFGSPIGVVAQGLLDLGWSDVKVMGTAGFGSAPLDKIVPEAAWSQINYAGPPAGCYGPTGLSADQQAFVDAINATGGQVTALLAHAVGADILTGMQYAFTKAGSLDSAAAIKAMEGMADDPAAKDQPWLFFGGQGPRFSAQYHNPQNVDTTALAWVCHAGKAESGAFPGVPLAGGS